MGSRVFSMFERLARVPARFHNVSLDMEPAISGFCIVKTRGSGEKRFPQWKNRFAAPENVPESGKTPQSLRKRPGIWENVPERGKAVLRVGTESLLSLPRLRGKFGRLRPLILVADRN
jgi:hypothetical protein